MNNHRDFFAFLLTRLLRGVTAIYSSDDPDGPISTHTPLARRDKDDNDCIKEHEISTHTPLARRDIIFFNFGQRTIISTHTPLARRDRYNLT